MLNSISVLQKLLKLDREEKQAIKDAAAKKIEKSTEVVKAKAIVSGPKMVGKIEVPKTTKIKTKDKSVNLLPNSLDTNHKSEKEIRFRRKKSNLKTLSIT